MSPFSFGGKKSTPTTKSRKERLEEDSNHHSSDVERAPDDYLSSATRRYETKEEDGDEPCLSPSLHQNQSSSTAATTDDDPYVYSDESSLSDAYFFPQSDEEALARPPRYRTEHESSSLLLQQQQPPSASFPAAAYYGSLSATHVAHSLRAAGVVIREEEDDGTSHTATETTTGRRPSHNNRSRKRKVRRPRKHHDDSIFRSRGATRQPPLAQEEKEQEESSSAPKDVVWAILFLLQLGAIAICAVRFGYRLWFSHGSTEHVWTMPWNSQWWNRNRDTHGVVATAEEPFSFTFDYQNCMALIGITGLYSSVLTIITYGFMLVLSKVLIHITLIVSVLLALALGLIGLTVEPYGTISMLGFAALLLTLGYTMYNWTRIPFASTNLNTSLCALRCTADIMVLSLVCLSVTFAWCLLWGTAFIGIVNSMNHVECVHEDECGAHVALQHVWIYILLIFSFHWTNTVIKNITRVTVSSAVATWWFYPDDISPFCSPAVVRPSLRALTTSLGSICLGSLVVQPAQLFLDLGTLFCCCPSQTREVGCVPTPKKERSLRLSTSADEGDTSAMDTVGILDRLCWLRELIHTIFRSCSRWSYTYIGMYGDSFYSSGQQAMRLFETRAWLEAVKDVLIQNVLVMACVIISGSAGLFAVVVEEMDGYDFTAFHQPIVSAFVIGSVLGFVLSSVLLLGVVGSAANAVLVCFASGAYEFDHNHPTLSRDMREAWRQVWDGSVHARV